MNTKIPKSVMIIDDDKFLLDMNAMKFKNGGVEVTTYVSAEDALNAIIEGESPDVILFDLLMPKMDGYTFSKKLTEKNLAKESIKIVFSNQAQQSDVDKINELDVSGHIIKALHTPSEVYKKVVQIFNKE